MRIEMENVLYICITGFHTYETEGMGLQKFGKLLLSFQRERELIMFLALQLLPLIHVCPLVCRVGPSVCPPIKLKR